MRVEGVVDDDVLFGGKVAKERARRDLGGLGDLLDGRRTVALRAKQPQGGLLDGLVRLGLLALA